MAVEHDASQVFDPSNEDIIDHVYKATNNRGVDVAFECAGFQATMETALAALRPRGNYMNIAVWGETAKVSMMTVLLKEISITGKL